jgi:DNA end-binding protein Ku
MPRAFWKGYLRLSLVTCPIQLFPAISQSGRTHFHQINVKTGHRLRQQMIDEETGEPVDTEDKGRGYELSKGRYVPIDEEELKAVQVESTRTVDIQGFVARDEIDQRYLDRPYYVAPADKMGAEAFVVIREAMRERDRVALAKIVLAHREHIIALEPLDKGILGTTLRYDYEVRDEDDYFSGLTWPRANKEMVDLASHIITTKETKFDPGKFKDDYETALKKLVRRKAKGETIEAPDESAKPDNVIDLAEALRRSLGQERKPARRKTAAKKSRRRKAA